MASEVGRGDALADLSEIKEKLDGAIVVVPNHLHYDIARRFIDQGVHVLCEKPLTENGAQAKDLVEAAAAKGVVLCVNNTRRMFPAFQRIRELISAGGIGRLSPYPTWRAMYSTGIARPVFPSTPRSACTAF